ncbi:trypsin-like peptidase domain-containing protein [bacterium]|nr:trypsin-like peptidase domain-containing protein [bacterium]
MRKLLTVSTLLILAIVSIISAQSSIDLLRAMEDGFATVAEEVSPAVVYIEVSLDSDDYENYLFDLWGFGEMPEQQAAGSGVIIDSAGYVLTNAHVVHAATNIQVTLADERIYEAELVGSDPDSDVAIIRLLDADAGELPAARLGNSDDLRVGQWVLAIGSPFGLQQSVTAGIVSAVGRNQMGLAQYEDFIQTDASINPGNSGGPLVNLSGEVIGINSAIRSGGGYGEAYNIGIGFAIPINMAGEIAADLRANGSVRRGWLGVSIQNMTPEIAAALDLTEHGGALVSEVLPDSPAAAAGLQVGDVIIALDGESIHDSADLKNRVARLTVDERRYFVINRDGREREIRVLIGERPADLAAYYRELPEENSARVSSLGLAVQSLDDDLAAELGLSVPQGVVVTDVERGSAADEAGIYRGDVILQYDREDVSDAEHFSSLTRMVEEGEPILVLIWRDGRTVFLTIEVG